MAINVKGLLLSAVVVSFSLSLKPSDPLFTDGTEMHSCGACCYSGLEELSRYDVAAMNDTTIISGELYVVKLSEQLYTHVSYHTDPKWGRFTCNGMIYYPNDSAAVLFDTPMDDSVTEQLLDWIERTGYTEVTLFVPNHFHDDCLSGYDVLLSHGVDQILMNPMTRKLYDGNLNGMLPFYIPDFESAHFECFYPGPAHTDDNIVAWFPKEKVLFGGCMVKSAYSKSMGNIADANLKKWPKTIKKVKRKFKDAHLIVPGHGPAGGAELLDHTLYLLKVNRDDD